MTPQGQRAAITSGLLGRLAPGVYQNRPTPSGGQSDARCDAGPHGDAGGDSARHQREMARSTELVDLRQHLCTGNATPASGP